MTANRMQAPKVLLVSVAEGPATVRLSDQIRVAGLICRITGMRTPP